MKITIQLVKIKLLIYRSILSIKSKTAINFNFLIFKIGSINFQNSSEKIEQQNIALKIKLFWEGNV